MSSTAHSTGRRRQADLGLGLGHTDQPARPSKPLEYMKLNKSSVDISSSAPPPSATTSGGGRRHRRTSAEHATDRNRHSWSPAQDPPPRPPKLGSDGGKSSDPGPAGGHRQYAQKVRGSESPESGRFVAELEGDMASLKSSSDALDTPAKQGASGKKGKRNPDMAAMAQALVSESRVPPGKRKIRVLSLDGGGIRGYSTLVILTGLMHRIHVLINKNVPVGPYQLPRPCDFFDIIGGNGTGGLIALMLGRMRMDVETCKEYYEALTRYVFYTDKTILGMPYGNTLFKASRLEEAIKVCVRECTRYDHLPLLPYVPVSRADATRTPSPSQVQPTSSLRMHGMRKSSWSLDRKRSNSGVSGDRAVTPTSPSFPQNTVRHKDGGRQSTDYSGFSAVRGSRIDNTLGNPDTPLYDHRAGACKTLVTSTYISSARGSPPVLLRSYQTAGDPGVVSSKARIWEAGRATCATKSAFKPITIANVQFQDEGYGKYNPATYILDEALAKETWHDVEDVFEGGQDPEIGVFVSVGTGKRFHTQLDSYHRPGGGRKEKALWWENMGILEQYSEARKRLIDKVEDCEAVHLSLLHSGELEKRGVDRMNYYRFNVEVGVGEFGMNEWNRLAEVSTGTQRYLSRPEVECNVASCATKLADIWKENDVRDKNKAEGNLPQEEDPRGSAATLTPAVDEIDKKKEREKRRAARKASASAKGGTKPASPPMPSAPIAELEASISSPTLPGSHHNGSDGGGHQASTHSSSYGHAQQPPPPREYFSQSPPPVPIRHPQGYQPQGYRPQQVTHWVQHLPQSEYEPPLRIPTPSEYLPSIVTTGPPDEQPDDYFGQGPNPEIRVISPTTVAGDETPPGTPHELRKVRSIEADRQASRERRERREKRRREREEMEKLAQRGLGA